MLFNKPPFTVQNKFARGAVACLFLFLFHSNNLVAQNKRVVAIGSSTTLGYSSTNPDSSWFGRFSNYYRCRLGVMDSCYNYGIPGAGVYIGMPTGYQPPSGRPSPDLSKNVSKAVNILRTLANRSDGVIIVNYPSNDYNIYSITEIMNCLQVIYDSAIRDGSRCFITTTQPRHDEAFSSSAMKRKMAIIKDSTINRFGEAHTINFWDGMYNPADSTILPMYSAGDLVHFNNLGHRVLFERVLEKNVFDLPVWYASATGRLNLLSTWGSRKDGSGSRPTSFTADDQTFIVVNNLAPTISANWTVSGRNTQLILGDGVRPVKFTIPSNYRVNISGPLRASNCP